MGVCTGRSNHYHVIMLSYHVILSFYHGCMHRQVKSLSSSPAFAVQINASKAILHPDHHSYDQQGLRHATSSLPALWLGRIPTPSRGKNLVLQIPEKSSLQILEKSHLLILEQFIGGVFLDPLLYLRLNSGGSWKSLCVS